MKEPIRILNLLLKQIADEQNLSNYDLKIEPTSSGGANYTSTLYEVTFTNGDKNIYMFGKVATMGENMRTKAPKIYKTENFAYTKLLKVYERLEDEYDVPLEHKLVFSKFYGCNVKAYEETIVLENLLKSGFEAYDRFKPMTKEYAFSAIKSLGKFHALSLAYSEYYPEEFNKIIKELKFEVDMENEEMVEYFNSVVGRSIMTTKEESRGPLQRFFQELPKDAFTKWMTTAKRPVLGHGDYRPNNLMHRNREDGTVDIKILDLQTMQGNSPVIDLLYFIFTGCDEEFRAKYYDQLIDHSYTQLHVAMKRLNLDPEKVYSRQDFDNELKEKLPFGLAIAVFSLPIVTVDVENAPKVNEDLDWTGFSIMTTNDLYRERLNGVVNDYVKLGILK